MLSQRHIARLRYGWWAIFLVTLLLLSLEMMEHRPDLFALKPDFVLEMLGLLALPLIGGLGLSWLKRHGSEHLGKSVLSRRKETALDSKHVLVVEDDLLTEVVTSLLSQVKDLDIASLAFRDEAELVEEVERTRPAVVVLSTATKLSDPDGLICRLDERLDVRVVVVSMEGNTVKIFDKQRVSITRGQDLAAIIRSWIQV